MNVLLITQAFPPYSASGSVRVGKLAQFLIHQGHDLRVLTAAPLPYPRTLSLDIDERIVLRTTSLDPFALLALQRRRKKTSRAPGGGNHFLIGNGAAGKMLRTVGALVAIPEPQAGWYLTAVPAARRLFTNWKPDVIYASALPFVAHLVAARLSRMIEAPWIAEYRDHFAGNPYSNLPRWRLPVDRWLEQRVVASAAACVTVSEPMADTLRRRHRKPAYVVMNGFDDEAQEGSASPAADASGPLRILYTGVIYPGRRDPSPLFAAIHAQHLSPHDVAVSFVGQDLRGLGELASRYGVTGHVTVEPAIPYRACLRRQTEADVLLLLLGSDDPDHGVYTGKLFEYIGAGRPVLAVAGADGVAADLIRQRRLGIASSDPAIIGDALRMWLRQKRECGVVEAPAASARAGLSRSEQYARVIDLLTHVAFDVAAPAPATRGPRLR